MDERAETKRSKPHSLITCGSHVSTPTADHHVINFQTGTTISPESTGVKSLWLCRLPGLQGYVCMWVCAAVLNHVHLEFYVESPVFNGIAFGVGAFGT